MLQKFLLPNPDSFSFTQISTDSIASSQIAPRKRELLLNRDFNSSLDNSDKYFFIVETFFLFFVQGIGKNVSLFPIVSHNDKITTPSGFGAKYLEIGTGGARCTLAILYCFLV
jgi:hypothetical protein